MRNLYSRRKRLSLQYALQLSSSPANPTLDMTLRPKPISTFGIRILSLRRDLQIEPYQIEKILPTIMILALLGAHLLYAWILRALEKFDMKNPLVFSILEIHSTLKTLQKNVVF